jgi:hypothetical protein
MAPSLTTIHIKVRSFPASAPTVRDPRLPARTGRQYLSTRIEDTIAR